MSQAGVNCCSAPLTQHNQPTTRKKDKMAREKTKKTSKVRDLKPRKDAKAGRALYLKDLNAQKDARAGSSHTLSSGRLSSPNAINR
jgi:hypothetical protein